MINEFVKKGIEIAGSQEALAAALDVAQPTINKWLHCKSPVTPGKVIEFEKFTKGAVTRHQLRPDLYPIEEPTAA